MPYAVREYACAGCGVPVSRRGSSGADVRCIDCAVQRSVDAIHQLRERRGEHYQKWARRLSGAMVAEQAIAAASEIIEQASE